MVRFLTLSNIPIGMLSSPEDIDRVCMSPTTLQHVHGETVNVGDWQKNRRTIKTDTPLPTGFPPVLRAVCGNTDRLRMTIQQHRHTDPNSGITSVRNKLRMHVLGAELCRVQPMFYFSLDPQNNLSFGCKIKMYALLPPPLDKICENFMLSVSKSEIALYIEAMRKGVQVQCPHSSCSLPSCSSS